MDAIKGGNELRFAANEYPGMRIKQISQQGGAASRRTNNKNGGRISHDAPVVTPSLEVSLTSVKRSPSVASSAIA